MQFSCRFQQLNKAQIAKKSFVQRKVQAKAKRDIFLPGADDRIPEYLDGTLPGDRGFDPLGLSRNETLRSWMATGELYNARWAMLGSVGIVVAAIWQKIQGTNVQWYDAAKLYPFPFLEWKGEYTQLFFFPQWFLFILYELWRLKDWSNIDGTRTSPNGNYPGGKIFDPLGVTADKNPEQLRELQEKEIRNGRLAMASWFAYNAQHYSTGKGPLDNLLDHISNPTGENILKYGLHPPSLPDFTVQI